MNSTANQPTSTSGDIKAAEAGTASWMTDKYDAPSLVGNQRQRSR